MHFKALLLLCGLLSFAAASTAPPAPNPGHNPGPNPAPHPGPNPGPHPVPHPVPQPVPHPGPHPGPTKHCDASNGFQPVCCHSRYPKYCNFQSRGPHTWDAKSGGAHCEHTYCCKPKRSAHGKIDVKIDVKKSCCYKLD